MWGAAHEAAWEVDPTPSDQTRHVRVVRLSSLSMVSWSRFMPACKNRWLHFQEFCELGEATLVAGDQSSWEYL